jgi:hypothetical protein
MTQNLKFKNKAKTNPKQNKAKNKTDLLVQPFRTQKVVEARGALDEG